MNNKTNMKLQGKIIASFVTILVLSLVLGIYAITADRKSVV
jgi:CHASE3 domain sensor protein